MYLALIVFAIVALAAGTLVARVTKGIFSLFRKDDDKEKTQKEDKKQPGGEGKKDASKKESESREAAESLKVEADFPDDQSIPLDHAQAAGITEVFWQNPTEFKIDGKQVADECVKRSSITYLEFNNRDLAGDDFMGFNLIIEQNSRMVLTYNAQAVATLTRVEKTVKSESDGKAVETKAVHYRTNVFPPRLAKGMVPRDIERMLSAASEIRAAEGDPELVTGRMTSLFCSAENIESFKRNVVPKVQAKESRPKVQERDDTQHKTRLTRVNR